MEIKKNVLAYLPHHIKPYGIGYAAHSLAMGMNNHLLVSELLSLKSDFAKGENHVKETYPTDWIYRVASRFKGEHHMIKKAEMKLRVISERYEVVHLWPGCSIDTVKYIKNTGAKIIIENINCHHKTSISILNEEYKRIGLDDSYNIPESKLIAENAILEYANFIFSPSPQVTNSLAGAGISHEKILNTSYGLDTDDLISTARIEGKSHNEFTALFVGSVIPRKGVHLLLEYWQASKIKGKLKIIGKVDSVMKAVLAKYEADPSIEFISFTNDLNSHYSTADVFLMPSLEEGSPLVTYLAIGAGLPCLVSPMAGDGIIRENIEGYIIEPHNKLGWIDKLQTIYENRQLRMALALASRQRAEEFLWNNVATKRAQQILTKVIS
ncbi:glycosyltransferase family 4 protein [Methylophaga sulfidovorans]|uniref:Glycosyltransferase involved in cell wall bisynthesis n=1 Tax=Methylophaga sulfidovorans TaxID=45496 RepID=A0A1I3XMR2_9GAMM|nr:glycosyltransferase family 4 protein [Methylophaga sulfidovorans]SFK20768.1 Glycosyltransferase involved in cell wall bisynthesis [Methylophaga sulfidovorans]